MNKTRRKEGFKNQKLFVIPESVTKKAAEYPLGKNLRITDIGYFPNAKYHYRERKKGGSQHILIYCTGGSGFIQANKKREIIKENDILVIPARTPHVYGAGENNPWNIYWAHFMGNMAGHYYDKKLEEIAKLPVDKIPLVSSLFNSIFNTLEKGYTIDNIIYSYHVFAHLLSVFLFFYNKDSIADKQANQINNTIIYMRENLDKNISLSELAKINKLSKSHLSLIFRKKTGHTPIDYYIRLKIQQACRYLDLTDKNIKEIANNLGYNDPYYFSRIFKKVMGTSPSQYRVIKKG